MFLPLLGTNYGAEDICPKPPQTYNCGVQQIMAHTKQYPEFPPLLRYIGENIRFRRDQLGWSQEELGAAAGVNRSYISDIERGRRNITILMLNRITDALTIPLATVFAHQ